MLSIAEGVMATVMAPEEVSISDMLCSPCPADVVEAEAEAADETADDDDGADGLLPSPDSTSSLAKVVVSNRKLTSWAHPFTGEALKDTSDNADVSSSGSPSSSSSSEAVEDDSDELSAVVFPMESESSLSHLPIGRFDCSESASISLNARLLLLLLVLTVPVPQKYDDDDDDDDNAGANRHDS
jgi:hypothetical protein